MKTVKNNKPETSKSKSPYTRCDFVKHAMVVAWVAAAMLNFVACKTVSPPPPSESSSAIAYQEGVPGGVMVNTVEVSARVTAVNRVNREVTLLESDGETFNVKVGPEAVHFDQIQVGDLVKATVAEQLVVFLAEDKAASMDEAAAVVALGAQPGGLAAETRQIAGTVTAIDLEKRTATLRFQDGSTKTFPVRSDIDLSEHRVGEQVVFRITEMMAIRIEKH